MKKYVSILLIFAMLLPILSGCAKSIDNSGYVPTGDAILMEDEVYVEQEEEEEEQELTLAYYPDRKLNPLFGSDYTNRVLMSLMYQGLFAVDSEKNVTPILAGKYRSTTDLRNWFVYLDSNATFSDGSRVTVEDVIATYNQAMVNDYYKNRFYKHLLSVDATEDGGIQFSLDTPIQNFPMLLDVPIVKASEVESELPMGTGPYIFTSGVGGAVLQRNENWWCGDLKIPARDQTINLVEVSSPAEVRDAFQFGENPVSVVCTNPMSDSFAEYRCDYELWNIESGYFMYIGCNILYSDFFEDGTLRTFLTYAIDRAALAEDAYKGMVDTVTLPASPSESYYNKTLASKFEYDPLKFVSHLSSYRIPQKEKGGNQEMRLLVNADDSARVRIARSIAETLTEFGLPCTTMECSGSVYQDAVYAQNYDIYLGMTRLSANMDLSEFFRPYGFMSKGGLQHESLYSMCLHALEDVGNYYNLYQKLAEDGRLIPVMFGYYNVYAHRGLLPDLNPSRDNVFYYSLGKTMEDIEIQETYEEEE